MTDYITSDGGIKDTFGYFGLLRGICHHPLIMTSGQCGWCSELTIIRSRLRLEFKDCS